MYRKGNIIYLAPSELYWGNAPERIHTVLGSCIAITFWIEKKQCGGMCHFMMPGADEKDNRSNGRYCNDSIQTLCDMMHKAGFDKKDVVTKIIGGAVMFDPGHDELTIGDNNIRCAEQQLEKHGLKISGRQTGGCASRHVIFDLSTGHVWVKNNAGLKKLTIPGRCS